MKRLATILAFAFLVGMALSATASALPIGGHDETSENMFQAFPVVAPQTPTPGLIGPVLGGPHILISEVCVTPTGGEFIEICNPMPEPVALDDVFLSDDWYQPNGVGYFLLPTPGYTVGTTTDFTVKFPNGTVILPGQTLVVAVDGAAFLAFYGFPADFEINATDPTPDMVDYGNNAPRQPALITNSSEFVMMFEWDGMSDLVCDVDYACWGAVATGSPIDKTGLCVDGPDADANPSCYLPDTPVAAQILAAAPPFGASIQRMECMEYNEMMPGNGCIYGPVPTEGTTWGAVKAIYR